MLTDAYTESSNQLLALASQQGYHISSTQLARWHRAGLLSRPRQLPLRNARGTGSFYPEGTGEQLLKLCSLRRSERRLSYLVWQLWLAGYPVDLTHIRAQLRNAATHMSDILVWLAQLQALWCAEEGGDQVLDAIDQGVEKYSHYPVFRRVRKRVGSEHFTTFFHILFKVAIHLDKVALYNTLDEDEKNFELRLLAQGFGLEKSYIRKQLDLEYYLTTFLIPQLQENVAYLQEVDWLLLLTETTDFYLLQIRDELCTWLMRWKFAKEFQNILPADLPRWRIDVSTIFHSLKPDDQALIVMCWFALSHK